MGERHLVKPKRPAALFAWLSMILVAPMALVACGGGDGGGTGSDEDYVRDVCGAMAKFDEGLDDLLGSSPSSLDEIEELTKDMGSLFKDMANDLDDANPPADAKEANDALVSFLKEAAETLESGDIEAIDSLGEEPEFSLPEDVEARLSAVAEDIEECDDLDTPFGS